MAKITAPNKDFTGQGPHGVMFQNGKSVTEVYDHAILAYFARKGYTVSGDDAPSTADVSRAKALASDEDVFKSTGQSPEDAQISQGLTDAQRREQFGEGVGELVTGHPASPSGYPIILPGPDTDVFASAEDRKRLLANPAVTPVAVAGTADTRDDRTRKIEAPRVGTPPGEKATTAKKTTARKTSGRRRSSGRKKTTQRRSGGNQPPESQSGGGSS